MGWQEYRALVLRSKALNAKYGLGGAHVVASTPPAVTVAENGVRVGRLRDRRGRDARPRARGDGRLRGDPPHPADSRLLVGATRFRPQPGLPGQGRRRHRRYPLWSLPRGRVKPPDTPLLTLRVPRLVHSARPRPTAAVLSSRSENHP